MSMQEDWNKTGNQTYFITLLAELESMKGRQGKKAEIRQPRL